MSEAHTESSPSNQKGERIRADLILLALAVIWGSAFVAQRTGMNHVGPLTFIATRFVLGCLVLLPIIRWPRLRALPRDELAGGALLGTLLFIGAACQQIGLISTTAGKAGFITGLYVVIVPLLSALFWRQRIGWGSWSGAALAVAGLFLLSAPDMAGTLVPSVGDLWELAGAFTWALHVIAVGRIAPKRDPLRLALVQYAVCALLSGGFALTLESHTWAGIAPAIPAILYAGIFSTGVAYTGQIVAQRHAPAAHAAIIMSMESPFAALFGWLLLNERLSGVQLLGCGLMSVGMLLAQASTLIKPRSGRSTKRTGEPLGG